MGTLSSRAADLCCSGLSHRSESASPVRSSRYVCNGSRNTHCSPAYWRQVARGALSQTFVSGVAWWRWDYLDNVNSNKFSVWLNHFFPAPLTRFLFTFRAVSAFINTSLVKKHVDFFFFVLRLVVNILSIYYYANMGGDRVPGSALCLCTDIWSQVWVVPGNGPSDFSTWCGWGQSC